MHIILCAMLHVTVPNLKSKCSWQLYIVAGNKDLIVMHEILLNMSLHMYMYMSNTQYMCPWLSAEFVT